ncbi:hypothetical protein Pint_13157 [Pistacia integerrima]|uniref:Uncharacterized protein n=1 Tax=Pistacia integerrima TaxID=434235 RepID=A0ACC0Y7J8_9ROSI|nr:hypothetical protein Pint_13157 [Pistacia integerrima]
MCYPVAPLISRRDLMLVQGRWFVLQRSTVAVPAAPTEAAGEAGGGGSSGPIKQCICSPTRHPGSFRCRLHHAAEYVWGGRISKNESGS